jgi:hypothetical protein
MVLARTAEKFSKFSLEFFRDRMKFFRSIKQKENYGKTNTGWIPHDHATPHCVRWRESD